MCTCMYSQTYQYSHLCAKNVIYDNIEMLEGYPNLSLAMGDGVQGVGQGP